MSFRILAIDQGTTTSRSIIYDQHFLPLTSEHQDFSQYFPTPGHVEHDAMEIWDTVIRTASRALATAGPVRAIGITNQRETAIAWEANSGRPVSRAIVWQDRRTQDSLRDLARAGHEVLVSKKTGLLLDPYFSASKWRWILDSVPDGFRRASDREVLLGTVDSWLIYRLTGGREHVTDISNASRTLLMDLGTGDWDGELCELFGVPRAALPRIMPTAGNLGEAEIDGHVIPITAAIGDQQSALFGQQCHTPGLAKCTYGTGCFLLMLTGPEARLSDHRLLTTVAWKLGAEPIQYAMEGSVFIGGAAIQWLRDGLGIIESAPAINLLAGTVADSGGVVVVPAFTGLGAPHWNPSTRASIFGVSRGTTSAHLARATLEGIAFQVGEILRAMQKDSGQPLRVLRVDGGASASNLLMQIQADLSGITVQRPLDLESTARGAAMMAAIGAGCLTGDDLSTNESFRNFEPVIDDPGRAARWRGWESAVECAMNWKP